MSTHADVNLESVRFHRNSGAYRGRYDRETTPAPMAVIAVVARALNLDPLEMDPLHHSVDTDALDAVFRVRDALGEAVHVSFTYQECDVTVSSEEVVAVPPSELERAEASAGEFALE